MEGGMEGLTELTSGIPLGPAGPGGGVVEALQHHRRGIDGVAACHNVGAGARGHDRIVVIMTTTGIAIIGGPRHCFVLPRLRWKLDGFGTVDCSVGASESRRDL